MIWKINSALSINLAKKSFNSLNNRSHTNIIKSSLKYCDFSSIKKFKQTRFSI